MFDPSSLKIEDYSTIVNKYKKYENIVDTDYMTHTEEPEDPIEPDHPAQSPKDSMEALSTKEDETKERFVCPTCKYTFARMQNLLNHMERKTRCISNNRKNLILNGIVPGTTINFSI
jgi:hypothetical protein